uniref:Tetratricopeptide repeat protein 12 n=1 Tax=Leptobrachium leishanense TaxID=445787 RepID=A0A8C5PKR1_9ANUR
MSTDKRLDDFLKNIDEIADIIQGLNSTDESCWKNAFLKADKRLSLLKDEGDTEGARTRVNRTCINTSPSRMIPPHCVSKKSDVSQDSFLRELEKDAKQRAERRKENEALANALKDLGNEVYAKGDYATAVQRYTEGLEKLKDMQVLYTNRAQAYINLERHRDAITDCEWALRCNKKCIKAYVHMGRAYMELKNYEEARRCYAKILQLEPSKEKLVKDYLEKVISREKKQNQEQKASEEHETGKESAVAVAHLIQKLSREDQVALYYSGGIKILVGLVRDCTGQTLFRMKNGFNIIGDNKVINRSLDTALEDPVHKDLFLSVLTLWKAVCDGNEENQCLLIAHPNLKSQILPGLSANDPDLQTETLALLSVYSSTERGKSLLLQHMDTSRLMKILLEYVRLKDVRAIDGMNILYNLTLDERFKIHLRTSFCSALLSCFTDVLKKIKMANKEAFPRYVSVFGNLVEDTDIRRLMAASVECWDSFLVMVDECRTQEESRDILPPVLGLMLNLSLESNKAIQEHAVDITSRCMQLMQSRDGVVVTRSVGLLSRVLPQCTMSVQHAAQGGIVKKLIKMLKAGGQRTSLYAVKALALCVKENAEARKDVVKYDKKFNKLLELLSCEDEIIVGNSALCLGYCFEVPGAASSLLQSNILNLLLSHAKEDTKKTAVQQNAAIALGKLCTAENRFIIQLRELHGIEILNSCMKSIK